MSRIMKVNPIDALPKKIEKILFLLWLGHGQRKFIHTDSFIFMECEYSGYFLRN